MRHYGYGPDLWAMALVGLLLLALAVAAAGAVIVFATRRGRRPAAPWTAPSTTAPAVAPGSAALTILDERLARGEIDVSAYRSLRAELTSPG